MRALPWTWSVLAVNQPGRFGGCFFVEVTLGWMSCHTLQQIDLLWIPLNQIGHSKKIEHVEPETGICFFEIIMMQPFFFRGCRYIYHYSLWTLPKCNITCMVGFLHWQQFFTHDFAGMFFCTKNWASFGTKKLVPRSSGKNQKLRYTLLETDISPEKAILKIIFLFQRWDMIVAWRVCVLNVFLNSWLPCLGVQSTWTYLFVFFRSFQNATQL